VERSGAVWRAPVKPGAPAILFGGEPVALKIIVARLDRAISRDGL
jgi:hypothetical protein